MIFSSVCDKFIIIQAVGYVKAYGKKISTPTLKSVHTRSNHYKPPILNEDRGFVVLVAGLEPARYLYRGILSPLRLPIPPHEREL